MGRFLIVAGDIVKIGGMDRANYALASYLARRGDEVHLVTFRAAEDLLERPNVTVHRVRRRVNWYTIDRLFVHRVGRREARRIAGRGGRVVVNGGNCAWGDVNWVHHVNAADTSRAAAGRVRRIKDRIDRWQFTAEERRIVPRARLVITTCNRTRDQIRDYLGVPAERIRVVYLGIDPELFHPAEPAERAATRARLGWSDERPVLLFIGELATSRKGFDTLFAAWRILCAEASWDADLAVVGRGKQLPSWQARAGAEGLGDRIHFLGSRRDLPEILRAADAHVLPSRYEGYSMVTQEALCCGLPAFITRASGIAERFPEALRELILSDPEDVTDLVAHLRRWRDRAPEYRSAVAAFGRVLRDHTWDRMSEQITALIEQAP